MVVMMIIMLEGGDWMVGMVVAGEGYQRIVVTTLVF